MSTLTKVSDNGYDRWFNDKGLLHREDGPAVERHDGKWWYYNGELIGSSWGGYTQKDFEDWLNGARVDEHGDKHYYNSEKQLHRTDGPAVECVNGTKCWYINGKRHRTDGPAVELYNGTKHWYINDKFHREDGPAVERHNGNKIWFYDGENIGESVNGFTQEDFERYLKIKEY